MVMAAAIDRPLTLSNPQLQFQSFTALTSMYEDQEA
jgi:hypothetical protein